MQKNILLFNPSFSASNMYLPYFWATAKTYYQHKGLYKDNYNWVNPLFNFYNNIEEIKQFIRANPPSVFGVSLYVWNHTIALTIAAWVREEFPNCLIISGGPHQYFKHEPSWFVDNPFLDASLAGDEYGEITMCDILDNYNNLNWNNVHAVVYPSKNRSIIMHSRKSANKREFWWNYSVYEQQYNHLLEYKHAMEEYDPRFIAQGLLETTRGCPYACTFCDWGGGTASKVIAKDMEYVKQDIKRLAELNVEGVFFCDANLGILKERDIEVMQYIADTKKQYPNMFSMHYGGYAKTSKAIPYIKKILEIEAKNHLMRALTYKLSVQTLDQETLKNIDRTDVLFEDYLTLSQHLQKNYGYDAYAEIIAGLPGINPDKFYHEINVFSNNNINMNFYDWYLLPETPSYDQTYRQKYKIKTVNKQFGNHCPDSYSGGFARASEIVVGSYSYDQIDYKEMHFGYAWYRAFWTLGLLSNTIEKINIPLGDFTKEFYRSFFISNRSKFLIDLNLNIDQTLEYFFNDTTTMMLFNTEYTNQADPVKLIAMAIFMKLDQFDVDLAEWICSVWPNISMKDIQDDLAKMITSKNFLSKQGLIFKRHNTHDIFRNVTSINQFEDVLSMYSSSSIPVPLRKILRVKTILG